MDESYELVVIGAGAAGLLAASRAAELGLRVLLLEKNRKPGVKILMSGGTRCNLTHDTDARGILEAFGRQGRFLHSALWALDPRATVELFHAEGVATKVESTGKIFPESNRALDVQQALVRRARRCGVTLALEEPVVALRHAAPGMEVTTARRSLQAPRVLVASGGQSYPGCGTQGDAYAWLQELGHTIVAPRPALVPVVLAEPWLAELSGITLGDVQVRVVDAHTPANGRGPSKRSADDERASDRGSFLITHFGLSGPTVMNVSRAITAHPEPARLRLICDLLPEMPAAALDAQLRETATGRRQVGTLLPEAIPLRLATALVHQAGIPVERRAAELTRDERSRLVEQVKRLSLAIRGTRGFPKAEVTAGGVSLDEVDSRTMESKRVPGLFLVGEVLDLDGPIGGYNFQAAFSTAWLAASRMG